MAKITDLQMKSTPVGKTLWFFESQIYRHGSLVGRVTPAGERLFYFRYVDSRAKQINYPLGSYGNKGKGLSVVDARKKALQLAELHQSGITDIREYLQAEVARINAEAEAEKVRLEAERLAEIARLDAERRALEARITVKDLFDKWFKVQISRRKDGGREVKRIFDNDVLPLVGHLYVAEVGKGNITDIADAQLERGTNRLARMTFTLIRQMFRFAVERDLIPLDPTANTRKANIGRKETERERVLSEDEIRDLYRRLPDADLILPTALSIWIALSTCCRIGELLKARWEHIDLKKGTWLIPVENSKNGKAHTVYLSTFAVGKFECLKQINGSSVWCYPNPDDKAHVNTSTVTRQLSDRQHSKEESMQANRTSKVNALMLSGGRWTPHDLRRTGATMMTALGVLPEVAERCLNHTEENRVKRTYQRHNYSIEMREAWRVLGERLELLCAAPEC